MSSKKRKWKFRLKHILQSIDKIVSCTADSSFEEFEDNWIVVDAVQMNLMVIGEAARHIPDEIVRKYPEIPWAEMRGLRNVLAHEYDRVEFEVIWQVAKEELPEIKPRLERVYTVEDE